MKNENLPATPLANEELSDRFFEGVELATGLTKREHFAAMALQGLLANPVTGDADLHDSPAEWRKDMSEAAVEFADATLAVLNAD